MLTLYKANQYKADHKLTLSKDCKDYGKSDKTDEIYNDQLLYHNAYEFAMRTARNKYEHKVRDVIEDIHYLCGGLSYREGILEKFYGDQDFARLIAKFIRSGYEPMPADLASYKCVDVVDIYLCLAYFSCMNGWKTSDINVLKKHQNIAYYLAIDSGITRWTTNDKEILFFRDGKVALELAKRSVLNGWTTNDKEILKLCHGEVALELVKNSDKNGWTTDDKEILKLCQGGVAFWLSKCQKLSTSDSEMLDLVEAYRNQYNKKIANLRGKSAI